MPDEHINETEAKKLIRSIFTDGTLAVWGHARQEMSSDLPL